MPQGYKPLEIPGVTPITRDTNKIQNNQSITQTPASTSTAPIQNTNTQSSNNTITPSIPRPKIPTPKLPSFPIINKPKQTNNNQPMTEADKLTLDNILSFSKRPKTVEEQNEIIAQRSRNTNRLNELNREQNYITKSEREIKEIPRVMANSTSNIGGKTFTEEEWNKRQENLKKKEEIIDKINRKRSENIGINENSEYNSSNNKKEGQERKYQVAGIKVNDITYKEYQDFIKPTPEKTLKYHALLQDSKIFGGILGMNISKDLLKNFTEKGGDLYFNNSHKYTQKVKDSNEYKDFLDLIKKEVSGVKSEKDLKEKLSKYESFSIAFNNGDLKFAFGKVGGKLDGKIDEKGNLILNINLYDDYDFHFTNEDGERFIVNEEGSFLSKQYSWLNKQLNEAGLYYQENGRGKAYKWDMLISEKL